MTLDSDEIERWKGQPKQGIVFSGNDIYFIPVSILIVVFTFPRAISFDLSNLGFSPWGIPFLLIGLYFLIGRFIHDYIIRKNTQYIVTDKRIIIKKFTKFEYIQKGTWSSLILKEFPNGTGNIFFAEPKSVFKRLRKWGSVLSSYLGVPAFFRIQNVKKVYSFLED